MTEPTLLPNAPAGSLSSLLSEDDPRVTGPLREYQAALEAGQPLDRAEFLARHADIADVLAECLDALDMMHAAAGQLQQPAAASDANATFNAGQPLGDFQLLREIGRGGMGVVYEAEQISLSRKVAVKVLPLAGALDQRHLQRFKNEALAAAALDHPHIVDVLGVGCERGVHYYAMRLIEGHTLAEVIADLRPETEKTNPKGTKKTQSRRKTILVLLCALRVLLLLRRPCRSQAFPRNARLHPANSSAKSPSWASTLPKPSITPTSKESFTATSSHRI